MKKSRWVDHVSFSTNDVLSYPDECFTHFMHTSSHSSQAHDVSLDLLNSHMTLIHTPSSSTLKQRHIYDDHPLKLTCTAVLVLNTDGTPKMINIIVKYAKENEIHMMCSTTAQIVTLTAILIASWERPILK
ncbi:hypothetical protein M0R45_017645 [Rubus argutus]|uniref:Uncharacterized protein n=1 Tax=Rubus argutus TaxID=59490 RepID=A0AAW1XX23_RUBAR